MDGGQRAAGSGQCQRHTVSQRELAPYALVLSMPRTDGILVVLPAHCIASSNAPQPHQLSALSLLLHTSSRIRCLLKKRHMARRRAWTVKSILHKSPLHLSRTIRPREHLLCTSGRRTRQARQARQAICLAQTLSDVRACTCTCTCTCVVRRQRGPSRSVFWSVLMRRAWRWCRESVD